MHFKSFHYYTLNIYKLKLYRNCSTLRKLKKLFNMVIVHAIYVHSQILNKMMTCPLLAQGLSLVLFITANHHAEQI